ncbi:MAG: hypothetical protein NZM04_00465 [Methylacidiphilales bacterium]|nr:hypothetical protein [Candidatus Methylacidiphilales bacterium]
MNSTSSDIAETIQYLQELAVALTEHLETLQALRQDTHKWQELAHLLAELKLPVTQLKSQTETLAAKAQTLIDQNQLQAVMDTFIQYQNQQLQQYLLNANSQISHAAHEINSGLSHITKLNSELLKKIAEYLGTKTIEKYNAKQIDKSIAQLKLIVIAACTAAALLPLAILYTNPPIAPHHKRLLDTLHNQIINTK